MKKVRVWSLDVWGNEKEGFEVNDRSEIEQHEVADDFFVMENKKIVRWLKENGLIKRGIHTSSIEIDGDGETYLYIDDRRNGRPEYQIDLA